MPAHKQNGTLPPNHGPHPSYVQVAKPYVFEQELQECMKRTGATESKEDSNRLQGVAWIDNVRKALQLPVRTYNTAAVYYHKFRLIHPDGEYDYRDAAAAALFNACKIEDTLKKSKDILCAAYNLKLAPSEHLSSDDPIFEAHSKTILGLERLMLEASGFDFRNRYPQKILMKLVKSCALDERVGATAFKISLDMYRTFVPLKQTTQTMALATLELAIRLCGVDLATVKSEHGFDYDRWATTRYEIMETLLDMFDLYTHHRAATLIGPEYPLETFINIRITLNQEAAEHNYPRYTEWQEPKLASPPKEEKKKLEGIRLANGKVIAAKGSPPASPATPATPSQTLAPGERVKDGTVRFMLDPERAKDEKVVIKEFFRTEEVEETIWVDQDDSYDYQARSTPTYDPFLRDLAARYMSFTQPQADQSAKMTTEKDVGEDHYSPMDEVPRWEGTSRASPASTETSLKHMPNKNDSTSTSTPTPISSSIIQPSFHHQPLSNHQESAFPTVSRQAKFTSAYSDPSSYHINTQAHHPPSVPSIPTGPRADFTRQNPASAAHQPGRPSHISSHNIPPTAPRAFSTNTMSTHHYSAKHMPPPPPPMPGYYGNQYQPAAPFHQSHPAAGQAKVQTEHSKTQYQASSTFATPTPGLTHSPAYSTDHGSPMSISDGSYSPSMPGTPASSKVGAAGADVARPRDVEKSFETYGPKSKPIERDAYPRPSYGQPNQAPLRPQTHSMHFGDDPSDPNSATAKGQKKELDKLLSDQKIARAEWVLIQAKNGSHSDEAKAAYEKYLRIKKERSALRVEADGARKIMKEQSEKKYKNDPGQNRFLNMKKGGSTKSNSSGDSTDDASGSSRSSRKAADKASKQKKKDKRHATRKRKAQERDQKLAEERRAMYSNEEGY